MVYQKYVRKKIKNTMQFDEVSGIPCIIENSKGKNLKNYKIYGNSVQNGTPTAETPIEIESIGTKSINLLPCELTGFTNSSSMQYDPIELDVGIYTLNFKKLSRDNITTFRYKWKIFTDATLTQEITDNSSEYLEFNLNGDKGYYNSANNAFQSNGDRPLTTKLAKITVYKKCYLYIGLINTTGVKITANDSTIEAQLEKGNMITPYIPMNKYRIPILVKNGKNLLDIKTYYNEFYNNVNGITLITNQLPLLSKCEKILQGFYKHNTQYTFSFDYNILETTTTYLILQISYTDETSSTDRIGYYTASNKEIGIGHYSFTSSPGKTINYISWGYGSTNGKIFEGELSNMQLEEGSTETQFEPYKETITTNIYLDEPLYKIDKYADYIDFQRKKIIKVINNEYITNILNKSSSDGNYIKFLSEITYRPLLIEDDEPAQSKGIALSNKFKTSDYKYTNLQNYGGYIQPYITTNGDNRIAYTFNDTSITTIEQAQLAINNGFNVYYILAIPIEKDVVLPKIPTAKGYTTIEAITNIPISDMYIKYIK